MKSDLVDIAGEIQGADLMTYDEFKALWASLGDDQKESVRLKARWERMTLWAVCNDYPGIWNDPQRLAVIRHASATT